MGSFVPIAGGPILSGEHAMFEVTTLTVHGKPTAIGSAGPFTLVVDRPADAGGSGLGFNGGQLLYLAVAGCVSNDLFREAVAQGIPLTQVRVTVRGNFSGDPAVSEEISYDVEIDGDASPEQLTRLARHVDEIAEIPNSLRRGTRVRLGSIQHQPR
jgi:putative redox protein